MQCIRVHSVMDQIGNAILIFETLIGFDFRSAPRKSQRQQIPKFRLTELTRQSRGKLRRGNPICQSIFGWRDLRRLVWV